MQPVVYSDLRAEKERVGYEPTLWHRRIFSIGRGRVKQTTATFHLIPCVLLHLHSWHRGGEHICYYRNGQRIGLVRYKRLRRCVAVISKRHVRLTLAHFPSLQRAHANFIR